MKKWLLCLALFAAWSISAAVILENGELNAEIIIPSDANVVEKYAARELAEHLQLVSGKNVPVLTVAGGKRHQIRLGRAAKLDIARVAENSALVKIGKDSIDIAGRDGNGNPMTESVSVGTLFGVYEFLERELNIRWLWPGKSGTVAPAQKDVTLADSFYLVEPPLDYSVWRYYPSATQGWASPENGKKFAADTRVWLRRHRFNRLVNKAYGHAYTSFKKRYGKSHPEIFNLLPDGSRTSDLTYFNGRDDLISMCVSNPELVKLTVAEWQKNGTHTMVNVNENDTAGKCVCAKCLALDNNSDNGRVARAAKRFAEKDHLWYMELGSLSERYAAFYLAVQREADKINPDSRLIGCIYGNYYEAPVKVKLNDRIIMRFCPPIMYPWTAEKVASFKKLWQGWSESGVKLMLRPNFTHDGHNFPLMYHRQFAECFDFARDKGLDSCDYDSLMGVYGVNGITHYVIAAKNYSGRDKSVAALENEYLAAFGKAEPKMREFLELMTAATAKGYQNDDSSVEGSSHYGSFYEVAELVFTPEVMANGGKLLAEAEKAAADEPLSLERVKFVRAGFDDAMLVLAVQRGVVHYQKTGEPFPAAEAMRKLAEFRKNNEHIGYCDLEKCVVRENRKWPMHLAQLGGDSRELTNWQVVFDPAENGVKNQWFITPPAGAAITTDNHLENSEAYKNFIKTNEKKRYQAWYINKFDIKSINLSQQLKLTFGAVDGNSDIYLNGELIHSRKYPDKGDGDSWKKPFDVDVTGKIKAGGNLLVVHISKDHRFGGLSGIWRSVFLSRGKVNVADVAVNGWKVNCPQGKFSSRSSSYPLILSCTAPAENRNHAYKGVWGRFFRVESVKAGQSYEIQVQYRQKGEARLEMWIRSAAGGLGKSNVNIASPNENDISRTMTARFVAGSDQCTIYLNLLKGVGELEIHSVKIYPVTEL